MTEWSTHSFKLVIPPRGQARARSNVIIDHATGKPRTDPRTGRAIIIHHKSKDQTKDETKLEALMFEHRPAAPYKGPLLLGLRAYFPIPASKPKKWQAAALAGEIRPEIKPDFSNILKNIEDIGNGIFWPDDKHIVGMIGNSGKYYGDPARYELVIAYREDLQV